ncbi:OLC1v1023660C1 [Oldenlandia corymbosa var. corymbosa]|uniref:OLC1v1023660C1 n=1 Tax=Oldenlandia corymbosa var. corymbosa TaxID=529605 RepID=A0AAV1C0Y9_OLDCO|nr:OLC1v1023660C1 [Oldenlandia corymbosa var. corymbosa]
MKIATPFSHPFISLFFLVFFIIISEIATVGNGQNLGGIKRSHFPDDFLFGVSTSAYQIEGAILEDGKSPSDWDVFVHKTGTKNTDTGDIADDHYHRYLEDISLIHSLGVDAYRFSISWSRILPNGTYGGANSAGIKFYNSIIDNLLSRGIKPFVTIHHGDLPIVLQNRYGGWLSHLIQEDFVHYAETCFKYFGDRVKNWITINELNLVTKMGFETGVYPPGRCSPPFGNCRVGNSYTEPLIAMHNMLLSHARASKLYHDKYQPKQGGIIGIVANVFMFEPFSESDEDVEAASLALVFHAAWTFDPAVFGDYPEEMRHHRWNELPRFTEEEKQILKDSADFIGLNHYGTFYAKACNSSTNCDCTDSGCFWRDPSLSSLFTITTEKDGVLIGDPTGMMSCYVVPRGIGELVDYMKNRYHNKLIFITENGYAQLQQPDQIDEDLKNDVKRIEYHKAYLQSLAGAMRNGANVGGYFMWTLMDDYEWAIGYSLKYGLYSVDRTTLERRPRASANWYRDFLKKTKQRTRTSSSFKGRSKLLLKPETAQPKYE